LEDCSPRRAECSLTTRKRKAKFEPSHGWTGLR
jgi:hypothetical protein